MKKNYTSFLFGVITTLLIAVCGYFGYNFYKDYKKNKTQILQEIKLKPLTSEEIFNKNQDAVVLIKHTFVYKINALGDDFYFNDYNSQTGEISKLMSLEEARLNPIESWGTGFFIDNNGSILTNRHIVDVKPNTEEQRLILMAFKQALNNMFGIMKNNHENKGYELLNLKNRIENGYLDEYEYNNLKSQYEYGRDEYIRDEELLSKYQNIIQNFDLQNNYVTKTSIQFGVFFNRQTTTNLNDYIQYKSVKISNNDNVDLALLKPVNPNDLVGRKYAVANMSKIDSVTVKPLKITQKVIMIGYNHGIDVANTSEGIKPQLTEGNISQVTDKYKMLYTIPALHGSSGSPVFDVFGRVVGVNYLSVTSTNQNFNFGIQTEQIRNFLKN